MNIYKADPIKWSYKLAGINPPSLPAVSYFPEKKTTEAITPLRPDLKVNIKA